MPDRDRAALVLASGGITGLAYEVGALRALDQALVGRTVNDFDIFVGTSAGAIVAAYVAAGVPSLNLTQALAGTLPGFPRLTRWRIYRPNLMELGGRMRDSSGAVAAGVVGSLRSRDLAKLGAATASLRSVLPSGLLTTGGLEAYLRDVFASIGLADDFSAIAKELYVVATQLESGERIAFSRATHTRVPLSRAIAASAAIPMLFSPVEIDGHRYLDGAITGEAAVDIAVQRRARLVVVVNGLVPMNTSTILASATAEGSRRTVYDRGIRGIHNQVLREAHHENLVNHLQLLRERHQDVDFVLLEPRPDDEKMPFHQAMSFNARLIVMQHGYESIVGSLRKDWTRLSEVFAAHGLELSRAVIDQSPEPIPAEKMTGRTRILRQLRSTVLDRRGRGRGPATAPDGEARGEAAG